ncbi:MAG: NADH-quinone oxidoreductase subunit N [Bacteroidia bacterium]|nr:NADH-quinone oxidoreductase subunit N [Bacteroidia bacterium]
MNLDFFRLMLPELFLILIIFILLIIKIGDFVKQNTYLINIVNILFVLNIGAILLCFNNGELFSGMYISKSIFSFEKLILVCGSLIIFLLSHHWLKNHKHLAEFYILIISSLLGMEYMISSGNFLMFYLGLELASITLAALVNFDLEKKKSSEAAMKMILLSAFSSGIMLFGISLLYGTSGSLDFDVLKNSISANKLNIVALIFVFSGFAFKISAVPFHFWTADVYEGAPISVTAFLSVISKAAVVFVFISVLSPLFNNLYFLWNYLLIGIIALTITIANIFAIRQHNVKRFLAFSSIVQAGYILLAISANNSIAQSSAIYFIIIYLFSNLGVFAVVSAISDLYNKEEMKDYRGLYKNNPMLSWALALSIFSLAGIPPAAGFFGKIFLITSGAFTGNYALIALAVINLVISLYYYLMFIKKIFIEENEYPIEKLKPGLNVYLAISTCVCGILIIGFIGEIFEFITRLFVN